MNVKKRISEKKTQKELFYYKKEFAGSSPIYITMFFQNIYKRNYLFIYLLIWYTNYQRSSKTRTLVNLEFNKAIINYNKKRKTSHN